MLTLKCFSKMAERELADASPSNAQKCCEKKVTKRDHVFASIRHYRARFLKYYPRPPCASSQSENATCTTDTFLTYTGLYKDKELVLFFILVDFFILVSIHAENPRVPPRVLASGSKPCGSNK